MTKFFQKIILWIYIKIHTVLIYLSIALYHTEIDLLKADHNDLDKKNKKEQKKRHRVQFLNNFEQGQRDEKYVQEYYELLEKADKFIRTSTPHKMAIAADKHGSSYGMKDQYGRRYEHYGFFDEKHKHAGKTVGEVLKLDFEERRTKDDDYEILYIFNNKPIEVGFAKVLDVVEKTQKENVNFEYEVLDVFRKSEQFQFPIKIVRDNENAVNKIEQLTEFLHVKKIGFEYRMLEFFVPLKFKTSDLQEDSPIFKEILNFKQVFIKTDYGKLMGFAIIKFVKRITYNDTHEVLKFEGIEMENMKTMGT